MVKPAPFVCADCGAAVVARRGKWAVRKGRGFLYCCRVEVDGDVLVSADYHHIEGEPQRHFPVTGDNPEDS